VLLIIFGFQQPIFHNWCRWEGLGLERVLKIISTGFGHCGLRQLEKSPEIPQNMVFL
jgi:hypothetical protein